MNRKKIVIEGLTQSGEKFRPSDWAERMSGSLCTFKNRRITYSPMLQPTVQNGCACVILDPDLKDTNPSLFEEIMEFAQNNKLRIHGEEEKE